MTAATPTCRDTELLVRVHAASVDRGTWHLMAGVPYPIRLAVPGPRRKGFADDLKASYGRDVYLALRDQ